MTINIRKGDNVVVITGKEKGKTGKVLSVNPSDNTVIVANVNIIAKHQKPKKAGEKGGINKTEGKINVSNVQVICDACKKATRIAHAEENGKRFRKCAHCGASLDTAILTNKKEVKKVATPKSTATKVIPAKKEISKKDTLKKAEKKIVSKSITSATSKPVARKTPTKSSGK